MSFQSMNKSMKKLILRFLFPLPWAFIYLFFIYQYKKLVSDGCSWVERVGRGFLYLRSLKVNRFPRQNGICRNAAEQCTFRAKRELSESSQVSAPLRHPSREARLTDSNGIRWGIELRGKVFLTLSRQIHVRLEKSQDQEKNWKEPIYLKWRGSLSFQWSK